MRDKSGFRGRRLVARATFILFCCSLCVGLLWSAGCGNTDPAASGDSTLGPGPAGLECGHPNPGCPCSELGAARDCGTVEVKLGSYVTCSMGKTRCDGTKWGECIGDTVVAKSFSGGGLRIASLGASTACSSNPCDPYCSQFLDTPVGVDASPLAADDAGLYIPSTSPNACLCNQPSTPSAVYANISGTNQGNPASCSGNDAGSSTDNCNHDYHCVGGTCQPYAVSGVNPTCISSPDYTLGLGCYDGTSWELQVCNRGYVPSPGLGSLVIAISDGSPTTLPASCTTGATGATWPSAAVSGAAGDKGKCVINLATTSIGAGQCINVSLATQCTQLDGVTPLNSLSSAKHYAVINPANAVVGSTPLPECDTCNNYTAIEKSAEPPGLSNAAACATSTCGTVCGGGSDAGVDGGSGCHTYVSGTVYDPGGNIPLPGIAVYQPNVALTPFAAGVSCDTCATFLPPAANLVSATASDTTGHFDLEVNATTGIPVVFQTGRWRRKIVIGTDTPALTPCAVNNITVPADCYLPGTATLPGAYPATNCKTRLPQKASEGDIPLTAIVTGNKEPFECSIAKFMGGASEFGLGGGTKRMQLYQDNGASAISLAGALIRNGAGASVSVPQVVNGSGGAGLTTVVGGTSATYTYLHDPATYLVGAAGNRNWTITAPVVGAQTVTFPAAHGMTAVYIGGTITLWGATNATNNGTFVITGVPSTTKITFANAAGVVEAANAAHRWRSGYGGPFLSGGPWVGGTLTVAGLTTAANNKTSMTILSVVNAYTVTTNNTTAVANDTKSGQSGVTWTATSSPPNVVISGVNGMAAGDVGNNITILSAVNAGNLGTFPIASVLSATQVTIVNPAAVAEAGLPWQESGLATTPTLPAVETAMWDTQAHMNQFDEAILPCGGNTSAVATLGSGAAGSHLTTTEQGYVYTWLKNGGRSFGNHWSARGLEIPTTSGGFAAAGFNATSTFNGTIQSAPGSTLSGKVSPNATPTTAHSNFITWLTGQGAYPVTTPQPVSGEALTPAASSFEWLRGSTTSIGGGSDNWATLPGGNYSLIYSFDTAPTGVVASVGADGGAGTGCGRTMVSDMHVDVSRGSASGTFPGNCSLTAPLSPNEAAFDYLFFVLSSCSIGGAPIIASAPPPPPPPVPITAVTFTRDYHAVCAVGTRVVWQAFSWTAAIPPNTSIVFQAQTAPDASGAAGVYGVAVPVGTASVSTGATLYTPATTIDQDLTSAIPAQKSQEWLRMKMTFNPTGSTSPVLQSWNVTYDCLPAE